MMFNEKSGFDIKLMLIQLLLFVIQRINISLKPNQKNYISL